MSTAFAVLRPRTIEVDSTFLAYALRAPYFIDRVVASSTGVSFPAIGEAELGTFEVAFPTIGEQRSIARYLDRETARIDGLIAENQKLIDLIVERRLCAISDAVNNGLNGTVHLKPTTSPFFTRIPKNWELRKLRRIITQVKRPVEVEPETDYHEIGIRSWGKGIFHKDLLKGSQLEEKNVFRIKPGDLVLNIVFAWEGAVAVAGISEEGMIASHRFPTFVHSPEVNLDYLLLVLQSGPGRSIMAINSPGAAGRNKTIRLKQFLNEEIPVPSLEEQHRVVDAVREQEDRLRALDMAVRTAIEDLNEKRIALISAAVTGQIDVREL
ncbi:MAG: restriction endonuclease subunit S [Gemmatimonadota bacterium]